MLAELKPTSRENWRTVRFDEMAQLVNDRVDNPAESGVEFYVGLEHLDSESLKIRRWGKPTDVEAQKLRFKPGDIIFGKRRAYQRKVAAAEFEGICSAHAMVLRAFEENIVKDFLPFFMQSDVFFDVALSISVGSLSPTINWKTLAAETFSIPSKDEQQRIAEILWAANDVIEKTETLRENLTQYQTQFRQSIFDNGHNWKISALGDVFEVQLGKMLSPKSKTGHSPKSYLGNSNVQWGKFELDELKTMDFNDAEKKKFALKSGDLLVCEGGEVGRSAIWNGEMEECYYQKAVHRLRPKSEEIIPKFYLEYMFYAAWKGEFQSLTGHSTIAHLPAIKLKSLSVPVPSFDEQSNLMKVFENLENSIKAAESKILSSKSLVKELTKKLLLEN